MEFPFKVGKVFGLEHEGNAIFDASKLEELSRLQTPLQTNEDSYSKLSKILYEMGKKSAEAQKLKAPITNATRLKNTDHVVFLKYSGNVCLGFLKVGSKALFVHTPNKALKRIEPLCVLDFYVHESCQRSGHGYSLFSTMLQHKKETAPNLAYDKPSMKLLRFLAKHYELEDYCEQNNNYVVFDSYWDQEKPPNENNSFKFGKVKKLDCPNNTLTPSLRDFDEAVSDVSTVSGVSPSPKYKKNTWSVPAAGQARVVACQFHPYQHIW
eukprot:Platyproteum_vivax@DN7621_c4_g1_i1.p1